MSRSPENVLYQHYQDDPNQISYNSPTTRVTVTPHPLNRMRSTKSAHGPDGKIERSPGFCSSGCKYMVAAGCQLDADGSRAALQ